MGRPPAPASNWEAGARPPIIRGIRAGIRAKTRAAAARRGGPPPPRLNSVLPGFVHPDQAVLGMELFALHAGQGLVVQRQDAQFSVEHLLVEFAMSLEQLAELRISFHHRVDGFLWLTFKHRLTSF